MEKNEKSIQSTLQFLMYSYFGNWEEDPLYAAISRAYRDATMRAAFVFPNDKNEDDKETLKIYGAEIIRNEIMEYMADEFNSKSHIKDKKNKKAYERGKGLFKEELQEELQERVKCIDINNGDKYTDWHQKLCTELVSLYSIYSDKETVAVPFSYGNAQKWVNMTVKYLYLMSLLYLRSQKPKKWCEKIIKNSQFFHIPLDSYILKALFYILKRGESLCKKINGKYKEKNQPNSNLINAEDLSYADSNGKIMICEGGLARTENWNKDGEAVSWSNIKSYGDYGIIQKAVRSQIPKDQNDPEKFKLEPLEWENEVWILASQIINN